MKQGAVKGLRALARKEMEQREDDSGKGPWAKVLVANCLDFKALRVVRAKISQLDLACEVGFTQSYISAVECGRIRPNGPLIAWAKKLNATITPGSIQAWRGDFVFVTTRETERVIDWARGKPEVMLKLLRAMLKEEGA